MWAEDNTSVLTKKPFKVKSVLVKSSVGESAKSKGKERKLNPN